MGLLAERIGEPIIKAKPIDTVVRNRPAVEWIYETPSHQFAVEHTRIESFPNQIADGKRFVHLLRPLETKLVGQVPGAFLLIVDVGAATARAADRTEVRTVLAQWILAHAEALDPEEQTGPDGNCDITATPPGVPFEVALHRDCDYGSRLFIMQGLVDDVRGLRRKRIAEALARKCPKLQTAHNDGCVSVLILESASNVANQKKLADVVTALKQEGVLEGAQVGIAQSYLSFRNRALHAKWNEVNRPEVASVLGFTEALLVKHFSRPDTSLTL